MNKPTDEQINIAIAEHLGIMMSDYCNDLNAMHVAEQKLPTDKRLNFLQWLGYCGENNTAEVFGCVSASARDRAEAFLRAVRKWPAGS